MLSLAIKLVKWIMFSDLFICGISSVLWQQYRKDMWEPSDPENCEISQLCFMKISQSLCVPLHQRMLRGGRRLNHQFNHHSIYTKFIKKSLNQDLCTNFKKRKLFNRQIFAQIKLNPELWVNNFIWSKISILLVSNKTKQKIQINVLIISNHLCKNSKKMLKLILCSGNPRKSQILAR